MLAIIRFLSRRRAPINAIILLCVIVPFLLMFHPQPSQAGEGYRWPVNGRVVKGFEKPTGPYGEGGHQGVDIAAAPGTPVAAAQDGTVAWVGELPRGRFVSITHSGSVRTTCLDLDRIDVRRGSTVRRGQVIGTVSGRRDDSSLRPHLHFGASIHGNPVDPRLLLDGFDTGSFIRLCPVTRGSGQDSSGEVSRGEAPGLFSRLVDDLKGVTSGLSDVLGDAWGLVERCSIGVWDGAGALLRLTCGKIDALWDRAVYPGLCSAAKAVANAFKWVWSNRFVQATVAGIAAALIVVALVVLAVLSIGVSLVVAVVAVILGTIACIGMAIYYAVAHGPDFSLFTCFLGSLSAGVVVSGLVVSAGSLSSVFSAGWANLGVWGTVKAAAWSGAFSAIFEAGTGYLFTGQFSVKKILVAFTIGAISGAVGKLFRQGMASRRLVRILSFTASRSSHRVVVLGRSLMAIVGSRTVTVRGLLLVVKKAAVTVGTRVAYMGFTGTFAVTLNALACAISGRSMSFSSALASFLAGVAMGGIALSFGGKGISGLLAKFKFFQEGLGRALRGFAAKLIGKGMSKGMKTGLRTGLEKLFREKEVSK